MPASYARAAPNPVRAGASLLRHSVTRSAGAVIFNRFPFGYASRPRLRPRLTQGGRTFPWKPCPIGAQDSHLRLATHTGILSSARSTAPSGTASPLRGTLPYHYMKHIIR